MKEILKKEAYHFRQRNGLSTTEPIYFKSLLLQLKVQSLFRPLSTQNISGIAIKANEDLKFMLINTNIPRGRQHFTIAHELYHLFIQKDFTSMVCNAGVFDKSNVIEQQANAFASNLLLPEQGMYDLIPEIEFKKDKISLGTILSIEQYYQCSRLALLYRLKDLGLISTELIEIFKKDVIISAINYGYDIKLYEADKTNTFIGDYGTLARKLFDSERISESHYLRLMNDIGIDATRTGGELSGD